MWHDTVRRKAFRYAERIHELESDRIDKIVDETVAITLAACAAMVRRHYILSSSGGDLHTQGYNDALADLRRELEFAAEVRRVQESHA